MNAPIHLPEEHTLQPTPPVDDDDDDDDEKTKPGSGGGNIDPDDDDGGSDDDDDDDDDDETMWSGNKSGLVKSPAISGVLCYSSPRAAL